jgi:hypothetical protein
LSYKAIFGGGSTTASPLFRLLEVWKGTFAVDEADYKNSDLWSEIIKVLNSGYMRGMPVLRASKNGDDYDPRAFDVFGPKILTTRREFEDQALETRCLTLRMSDRQIRSDVPRQLPPAFHTEALALRNKLLRWRFENYFRILPDESQLLALEPRLTQIATPLWAVSQDDGFRKGLLKFLGDQADEHRANNPKVIVAEAIYELLENAPRWPAPLAVKDVAAKATIISDGMPDFSPKRTGTLLRGLGFEPWRNANGYHMGVTKAKFYQLIARYGLGTKPGGHK